MAQVGSNFKYAGDDLVNLPAIDTSQAPIFS